MNLKPPAWLDNAIFYEIYPQSFNDSNGDGIGDLNGITAKLDYILDMGFNAIWLNPCFVSPFEDAGYDVQDYYKIAPRYGTNGDARRLFQAAKKRGIRVLLDLVPGHTSWKHEWFKQSARHARNAFTDRYIWTDNALLKTWSGMDTIRGYSEREGGFVTNFFCTQPALNYGFRDPDPAQPWQMPVTHPAAKRTAAEIAKIMRFWLDLGADGFRVDLAGGMVKNDPDQTASMKLWRQITGPLQKRYPQAALVSEWGVPSKALRAGFDVDFMLHYPTPYYTSLFRHGAKSYFSAAGKGEAKSFLRGYLKERQGTERAGHIGIPSGNHDMHRLAQGRNRDELLTCFAFLLTMPGVPFVYYGDEIGMDYVEGLASKEGGYYRTGSRTPMQWSKGKNLGFSKAAASKLYLPVDARRGAPTVAAQEGDFASLLETVRLLNALRHSHPALQARGQFIPLHFGSGKEPMAYIRQAGQQRVLVVLHPYGKTSTLKLKINGLKKMHPLIPLAGRKMEMTAKGNSVTVKGTGTGFGICLIND